MSDTNTTIDLSPFCGDDYGKYDLRRPWRPGDGWEYASDRRICVRVPAPDTTQVMTTRRVPDLAAFPWSEGAADHWQPWPDWRTLVAVKGRGWGDCPHCWATGRVGEGVRKCEACDGEGCERCDDSGHVGGNKCLQCNGRSITKQWVRDLGDGLHIAGIYARRVGTLPGVVWQLIETLGLEEDEVIVLRFDGGGQGLLMPLSR